MMVYPRSQFLVNQQHHIVTRPKTFKIFLIIPSDICREIVIKGEVFLYMNEWWNSQISAWLRHTHWHSGRLKYEKSALWNFKKIIKYGKNIEKIEEKVVPNPFLGYLEPKFWIPGTITILQCEEKKSWFQPLTF